MKEQLKNKGIRGKFYGSQKAIRNAPLEKNKIKK
jgi:hypothetical protein